MPDLEEKLVLNKNGTIDLAFNGQSWHLRRPLLGEYRSLRERVNTISATRLVQPGDEDLTEDERLAAVKERELKLEREVIMFWREAVRTLDDQNKSMPGENAREGEEYPHADDELPPWLWSENIVTDLTKHWRTRPPVPGA